MSCGLLLRRLLLPVVLALAGATVHAQESAGDPPGRVARLSFIQGEVSIAPSGSEEWAEAVLNRPLTSGDTVWVDKDGRAELQVGSSVIHLDHDTSLGFIELDDDVMQMSLTGGKATIRVRRLGERESISVETPNGAVRLHRVGEYNIEVDVDGDRTTVKTRSGEAEMVADSGSHLVKADEVGVFTGLERLVVEKERLGPRTEFEAWANERDRREQNSESARYVSRDVIGYEDLDDHGEWIHEPSYGHVWRPLHVHADWAPYRYGRWAYIGPWGWTWIDDSYWGFAPFHYGRWVHVSHRWCWVPGPRHVRPVYAPALVGWIGGPSVSVSLTIGSGVGWYPLGPREIYYPYYRHTPRYVRYVNVSNTTVINNTYITNNYWRAGRHLDRGHDYRYRRDPNALTAVSREHFAAGGSLSGHRLRMRDDEMHQWRDDVRPRGIQPVEGSYLAAPPRGRWASRDADRNRERVVRNAPQDNPKRLLGDYRPSRTNIAPERRADNGRERLEVMQAEPQKESSRRSDHMVRPPVKAFQPDTRPDSGKDGQIRGREPRQGDFSFDRGQERNRDYNAGRDYSNRGRDREPRSVPPTQLQQPRFDSSRSYERSSPPPMKQPRFEAPPPTKQPRFESAPPAKQPRFESPPPARNLDHGGGHQSGSHSGGGESKSPRGREFGNPKSRER